MGKRKHQFINKKTAYRFKVVHRSQRDPLQPDDESSPHVLVPVDGKNVVAVPSGSDANQEEQVKYGVFYNDSYDYLQHLKPRGEGMLIMAEDERDITPVKDESFGTLNLPAEVLPSKYEEDIGMLNKGVLPRGPQPDWDPDIVAALDDDVDFDNPDNMLEDDFISKANPGDSKAMLSDGDGLERNIDDLVQRITKSDEEWETESDVSSTGNFDSDDLSDDENYSEEETKSHFTNYSMTSSVIRRTEGLKILDDHFERIMEEYDKEEIGPIDHEDTTGAFNINNDLISQVVEEFIDQQKTIPLSETVDEDIGDDNNCEEFKVNNHTEDDEKTFDECENKQSEKWDCVSIITTLSNLYNHPKLIVEPKMIKLHQKTGVPLGVFKEKKPSSEAIDTEVTMEEHVVLNNIRNKNESVGEKKVRKHEVKEQRKNRRIEKKENKMFFKDEHRKQEQVALNKAIQIGLKI